MKSFTVFVRFTNGATDFLKSTDLAVARAQYDAWRADIQSVYVRIS